MGETGETGKAQRGREKSELRPVSPFARLPRQEGE